MVTCLRGVSCAEFIGGVINKPKRCLATANLWKPRNNHFDPNYDVSVYGSMPRTKTGGVTLITLVPGRGGDMQWEAVMEIIKCAGAPLEFEIIKNDEDADEDLDNLLLSIQRNGIAVKGNIETRSSSIVGGVEISRNMIIRKHLDLFVRVFWMKSIKPLRHLMNHEDFDIVLIRQNTEGEFSLIEYSPLPNMVEHLAIVTRYNSKRIAKYAFDYSRLNQRKKITLVLNKHIIPESEEIFSSTFTEVSEEYPDIAFEMMDVTRFTTLLQYESKSLDVIVASSLIGSILVSIMQGFLGSREIIPSLNVGDKFKVYEAAYTSTVHQFETSGDNPISHIFIIISILRELKAEKAADAISDSLMETLKSGVMTLDMGGTASLSEFIRFMISCLKPKISGVQCSYDQPPTLPPKPSPTKPFHPDMMPGMVPPNPNYKDKSSS